MPRLSHASQTAFSGAETWLANYVNEVHDPMSSHLHENLINPLLSLR